MSIKQSGQRGVCGLPQWQSVRSEAFSEERILLDVGGGGAVGGVSSEQPGNQGTGVAADVRGDAILIALDPLVRVL